MVTTNVRPRRSVLEAPAATISTTATLHKVTSFDIPLSSFHSVSSVHRHAAAPIVPSRLIVQMSASPENIPDDSSSVRQDSTRRISSRGGEALSCLQVAEKASNLKFQVTRLKSELPKSGQILDS